MGKGQLADQFHAMAGALRIDLYEGVVSKVLKHNYYLTNLVLVFVFR